MKNLCQNNSLQKGYIRRYTLTDGKENGLKVVEMDNGIIRVKLNESKGLDMMQLFHKGANVSFVSKNGFTSRELPFLKRFEGGMVYTCGLDSVGGREGFELHGTYHNIPAKITNITESDEILEVCAEIEDTALFGKNLLMKRVVSLYADDDKVNVEDTLINKGTKAEDYCLLYHINVGYPMLDAGVEVVADASEIIPRSECSRLHLDDCKVIPAPVENEEERCYYLKNNKNSVEVINRKLGKKMTLTYSKETLPCFVEWVSPVLHDYALGIEPATTFLDDKFTYNSIDKGSEVKFSFSISVTDEM